VHDHRSVAYDFDTVVTDVDDTPSPPAISRTTTDGALTMQVHQNAEWHRRTPDLATTACGEPIHSQFSALRREELSGDLCRECFTPYERSKAAEKAKSERHGT